MDVDCGWIDTWLVECVNSQFLLPVRKTSISPSLAIELLLDGFYRKWFWHQLIFIYVKIPFQYEHWLDIITHTRSSSYSNMRWIRKRRYVRTTCHYSVFWWFVFHGFLVICYSNKYIYKTSVRPANKQQQQLQWTKKRQQQHSLTHTVKQIRSAVVYAV